MKSTVDLGVDGARGGGLYGSGEGDAMELVVLGGGADGR